MKNIMASVCGGAMAMMDAGVPIRAPVPGVAMGLVMNEDTGKCKVSGITMDIMRKALKQARQGRMHILGKMAETLGTARADISTFAPRIVTIQIPYDQDSGREDPRRHRLGW